MDSPRYLKQVLVVPKDLSMPAGKLAAMVAHAAMTFVTSRLRFISTEGESGTAAVRDVYQLETTMEQSQWLTELDPGLEEFNQVSFAKIVLSVKDKDELLKVEEAAKAANLTVHRVVDSGHSHNKKGDIACIAIGPAWPEQLQPVTGHLKVYR